MGTRRQEQQDGLCWGTAAAPGLSFALLVSHTHTHTHILLNTHTHTHILLHTHTLLHAHTLLPRKHLSRKDVWSSSSPPAHLG